jgi:hypothetical protein
VTIGAPRILLVSLAALFSSYHIVHGVYSLQLGYYTSQGPVLAALVIYAVATAALLIVSQRRTPIWLASFAFAVSVALPLLVSSQLEANREGGLSYSTWYVAACGTLLAIMVTVRRPGFAWAGIAFLVLQTILWSGPGALGEIGVVGSAAWVGIAHIITNALSKAARDSQRFALAEREATDWHAAQEAHLNERQFRLGQTSVMALPMLRAIQQSNGDLTAAQRAECLHLEGAIRDEIRGRKLLNNAVREQVMLARRRGTTVNLLDEGGIDDLDEAELERVHNELAKAIRDTTANLIIARTVPGGSDVAVTVVGLGTTGGGEARALGSEAAEDDEDSVDLWLEIPRVEVLKH